MNFKMKIFILKENENRSQSERAPNGRGRNILSNKINDDKHWIITHRINTMSLYDINEKLNKYSSSL